MVYYKKIKDLFWINNFEKSDNSQNIQKMRELTPMREFFFEDSFFTFFCFFVNYFNHFIKTNRDYDIIYFLNELCYGLIL
jgi:hypothetical protein